MVATKTFDDVYVHAPAELEVGGVKVIELTDPRVTDKSENGPRVGAPPVTVRVVVAVPVVHGLQADCTAEIVVVPTLISVAIFPLTVATDGFEEL
jgi:hypothetical protein